MVWFDCCSLTTASGFLEGICWRRLVFDCCDGGWGLVGCCMFAGLWTCDVWLMCIFVVFVDVSWIDALMKLGDACFLGVMLFYVCWSGVLLWIDEPESLILAQSERWRHA